jgi:ureidoglycolate lyase
MRLAVEVLSEAAFAPFGQVIEASAQHQQFSVNEGTSQRFHDLAQLQPGENGRLTISNFRAQPRRLPFQVRMLERHPLGSQAFMPLSGRPFLLVVAPAGAQVERSQLRAFLSNGCQGVNFAPGVWHHPLLALQAESDFLVVDRADPAGNCDELLLSEPCWLELDIMQGVLTC